MTTSIAFSPLSSFTVHASTSSTIVIGEVAWAGSMLSTADEWLELWNTGTTTVSLAGWSIRTVGDSNTLIPFPADAVVTPLSTYIISNYSAMDSKSVLAVDPQVVTTTMSLSNSALKVELLDANGLVVDSAGTGGAPPAGASLPTKLSMIRSGESWTNAATSTNLKPGASDLATPGMCDGCAAVPSPAPEPLPTPATTSTIELSSIVATSTDPSIIITDIIETPSTANTTTSSTQTALTSDAPPTEQLLTESATATPSTFLATTASSNQITTTIEPPPKPAYGMLRLSEVVPAPTSGKEWIEITSLDAGNAIKLDGCTVHDAQGRILTISKATFDPLKSRVLVIQLSSARLNNDGDTVSLYDPDGRLLDTMSYGKTTKGNSWIRFPDMTGAWQQTAQPTPGANNVFLPPPPPKASSQSMAEASKKADSALKLPEIVDVEDSFLAEPTFSAQDDLDLRDEPDLAETEAALTNAPAKKKTVKKKAASSSAATKPIHPITFDMLHTEELVAQRVLLHGTVATPPGFFKNRSFVLQAPDGRGILVTTPANQRQPEFTSAVSVVGTISFDEHNVPSIRIGAKDRWTTNGTSTEPSLPRLVDLFAPSSEDAWSLMHVTGTVSDVKGKTIYLDLDDATINVVIRPGVGYRAERLKPKDVISVTGILDTTSDDPRLLPRHAHEISIVSLAPETIKNTTRTTGPTLPPWTPIGAAGGAIAMTEGAKHLHRRRRQKKLEQQLIDLSLVTQEDGGTHTKNPRGS